MIERYVMKNERLYLSTATHGIVAWRFDFGDNIYLTDIFHVNDLLVEQSDQPRIITTHYFLITYKQPVAQVKS